MSHDPKTQDNPLKQESEQAITDLRSQVDRMRKRLTEADHPRPEDFEEQANRLAKELNSVERALEDYENESKGSWEGLSRLIAEMGRKVDGLVQS